MTQLEQISAQLRSIKLDPGVAYFEHDGAGRATGNFMVCCDEGLFVGNLGVNEYSNQTIGGAIQPWKTVSGGRMKLEGLLADETGPFSLTVEIDNPKFAATWQVANRIPTVVTPETSWQPLARRWSAAKARDQPR